MLEAGRASVHPFVIGELACGNLANRSEVLALLDRLPQSPVATQGEILTFIEHHELMGRGIGFVDAHLLASALLGQISLWTRDRRLAMLATDLGVAYHEGRV